MDSLDIAPLAADVIPRYDLDFPPTAPRYPRESVEPSDSAAVALQMVSEAATAIRYFEEQSLEAVARARDLANSLIKELESAEARADRAEAAQRELEAEVQEFSAVLGKTRADLDLARRELADKHKRLAATEERLRLTEAKERDAQQRAMNANAAIQQIVEAIRTQLPGPEDLSAQI